MVFSSLLFLIYFLPVSIIVFYLLSFSIKLQNVWLLAVSLLFYAWGEPVYVFIMIGSIIVNWLLGLVVGKNLDKSNMVSKGALVVAIAFNVGVLFIFKYLDFVIEIINSIAHQELIDELNIPLPIGISFFTFQAMSYVIDVYRRDAKWQKNPFYMGLYISFFPQLVAGPIVRYNTIEKLITDRKTSWADFEYGINRFAMGMVKKVVIANNIAVLTDRIYELVKTGRGLYEVPVTMAWIGAVGYMLQIYFDFSAYSDMAIGLGRCFGFYFDENFNYPYVSKSIGEFWRRWHISLGTWFKEYVYFPLGGSRVENQDLMVKNTFIVWLLTGIWHGASWTFIAWGLFHFIFLILERMIGFEKLNIPDAIKRSYTIFVVLIGWVLFKSESIYQLREMIMDMFMLNKNCFINPTTVWILKEYSIFFILGIVFSTPVYKVYTRYIANCEKKAISISMRTIYLLVMSFGMVIALLGLIRGDYNPFIYFNF